METHTGEALRGSMLVGGSPIWKEQLPIWDGHIRAEAVVQMRKGSD